MRGLANLAVSLVAATLALGCATIAENAVVRVRLAPIVPGASGTFRVEIPRLADPAQAVALEGERALKRVADADAVAAGRGRFTIDGRLLTLSSSDASDPRKNGQLYTLRYSIPPLAESFRLAQRRLSEPVAPALIMPPERMRPQSGLRFEFVLPDALGGWMSQAQRAYASRLVVMEDGVPLPKPNRTVAEIERERGAYVHWNESIAFSSLDGSDPRTNGHQYTIGFTAEPDHRYSDWRAGRPPRVSEVLPAPRWAEPRDGERLALARPTLRIADPDPSLLYYFEIDVAPSFDSPSLLRRPGVSHGALGADPRSVIDRAPEFGASFAPTYRLGALAPLNRALDNRLAVRDLAQRLGFGLAPGEAQVREVYEYVRTQIYPADEPYSFAPYEETLKRDRGWCKTLNFLTSQLLSELGYATRRVALWVPRFEALHQFGLGQHSSLEVFYGGRWSIVDPYVQLFLPGTSYRRIASDASLPNPVVRRMSRSMQLVPDLAARLASLSDAELVITVRDYAQQRRYDRFEDRSMSDPPAGAAEDALYAGEPHRIVDPPFGDLWREPVLTLYVRARGLRIGREDLDILATNEKRTAPSRREIDGTPWSTLRFEIDLRAAYAAATAGSAR